MTAPRPRPGWLTGSTPEAPGRASTDIPPMIREAVYIRAAGRCESCGHLVSVETGRHVHHRRPRGMGGSRDTATNRLSNLLCLCPSCHQLVERHRTDALNAGFLVRKAADPARVAVELWEGRRVLLADDGTYIDYEE